MDQKAPSLSLLQEETRKSILKCVREILLLERMSLSSTCETPKDERESPRSLDCPSQRAARYTKRGLFRKWTHWREK